MANQFARYNPALASPQPIMAWYDNTMGRYPSLPPIAAATPAGYIAVTSDVWAAHLADMRVSAWSVVNGVVTHASG